MNIYVRLKRVGLLLFILLLGIALVIITRRMNQKSMEDQLNLLETYIEQRDKTNLEVSKVDVAWHIDHSLKTINGIYTLLAQSNPKDFRPNFNFSRLWVYTWGDFPRGVAKAPKRVLPPEVISTESLYQQLETAKKNLEKLESLDAKAHFEHPYFGVIHKKQSKRFVQIHTRHHLKIIRDILR